MGTTLDLILDLYRHVGPGIILAFALPVLLVFLGLILFSTYRRARGN